jgi:hypothetical protein
MRGPLARSLSTQAGWIYHLRLQVTTTGAAYVFVRTGTTWTQQYQLTAGDAAQNDYFGYSVALAGDGSTALVGAFAKNNTGAAYVFTRSGSTWTQQQELTASDGAPNDAFGWSVALAGNGRTVLVGAPYKDTYTGAAYVYAADGASAPTCTATPTASSTSTGTTTLTATTTPTATATPQPLTYNIQHGWNLFAYTDASIGIITASQLLGAILRQSGGSLAALYGLTQYRWFPSLVDSGGSYSPPNGDFTLLPATCYLVYSDHAATLSFPAAPASAQPVVHPLQQGWNLFAYTGSASGSTAAQVLGALLQQSGGSLAALYGLNNNQWTPSLIDSGGSFSPPNGDFSLQPDTGYLLYSDRAVRFSLEAARNHPRIQRTLRPNAADERRVRTHLPPLPPVP